MLEILFGRVQLKIVCEDQYWDRDLSPIIEHVLMLVEQAEIAI